MMTMAHPAFRSRILLLHLPFPKIKILIRFYKMLHFEMQLGVILFSGLPNREGVAWILPGKLVPAARNYKEDLERTPLAGD